MITSKTLLKVKFALLLGAALSACSGGKVTEENPSQQQEPPKPPEPIELKIHAAGVKEEEFNDRFRDVLKKKFPHITIVFMPSAGAENSLVNTVARGEVPDIIRNISSTVHTNYLDLGLAYDMNEMVKKYNYDLNRFNPIFVQGFKDITSRNGELYGLPVSPFFSRVLYYNKDLFDKFGQPYLKDGMSMDEVYNVARAMTRSEDGAVYRGYSANITSIIAYNSYSLPALDPDKDQLAGIDTWKNIFDSYMRFFQIPNNKVEASISAEAGAFKKGNVAMWSDNYSPYLDLSAIPNWDMVSIPLVEGAPKKVGIFSPGYLLITKQSKHKDEAFKVIMEMLSDEVQLKDSRNGFFPTLANNKYMDVLAQDSPTYRGKNMKAVTYYEFAPPRPVRKEGMTIVDSSTADSFLRNGFLNAALGKEDVNTALRNADELLRKEVEKVKSQSK